MGVTSIQGTSDVHNGGFTYQTTDLLFSNSPEMIFYRWIHEAVYHDLDGTLTGAADRKVVASTPILPPAKCEESPSFSVGIPWQCLRK